MLEKTDELYEKYLCAIIDAICNLGDENKYPIVVRVDDKYYLEISPGQLSKHGFDRIDKFREGFARVKFELNSHYRFSFINQNGDFINSDIYSGAGEFHNGYAIVLDSKGYFYIGKDGKPITKKRFDNAYNFTKDGFARVFKNGQWNYINTKGELLLEQGIKDSAGKYSEYKNDNKACDFVNGYARIKVGKDEWDYIDTSGQYIFGPKRKVAYAKDFGEDGYATGGIINEYQSHTYKKSYFDGKGNIVSSVKYEEAYPFVNGHALVQLYCRFEGRDTDELCWAIIDKNFNVVGNKYYIDATILDDGTVIVRRPYEVNYIDMNTGLPAGAWIPSYDSIGWKKNTEICNKNFIKYGHYYDCLTRDLGDYHVEPKLINNIISNGRITFKVKKDYNLIKAFGERYLLFQQVTENREKKVFTRLYLYDVDRKEFEYIGSPQEVTFDDYFIRIHERSFNKKCYFIYNNKKYDVPEDYYKKFLVGREQINFTPGIEIKSKDDFFIEYEEMIKRASDEKRKAMLDAKEKESLAQEMLALEKAKAQNEAQEIANQLEWDATTNTLIDAVKNLERLEKLRGVRVRVRISNLFIKVGNHKEINPIYISTIGLKHIDFSGVSLANVFVEGLDFEGCNINLDPQEVYGGSLKNCNFEGIHFSPLTDFSGIDIRGARFGSDNDPKTVDYINSFFSSAIYDETTIYNNEPLTKLIGECKQKKSSK